METVNCKLQKNIQQHCNLLVYFFWNTIMTVKSTCSYHFTRKTERAPKQPIMSWNVRWPLCFVCSCAPLVTQHYKCVKDFSAWIQLLQKMQEKVNAITYTPIINHLLKMKWPLLLTCSFALLTHHSSTDKEKVLETSLQWIHIVSEKPVGSHFALLQIDTLHYQQKKLDKGSTSIIELCLA